MPAAQTPSSQSLELWIGRKLFGWVAIVGFIVAAALLIRYAVAHGWLLPEFRVAGITLFGFGLLALGYHFHHTGLRRFSTMMSSGGIILVFQAGYASFGIYKLIPLSVANVVLPLIVVGGFLLAWFYKSKLLGTVSIIGGLAVPLLLDSSENSYPQFFAYLLLLNVGTVLLVNLLRRVPIAFLAFFGTQALFWMWYTEEYNPTILPAVLLFQLLFYLVYFADTTIAARTVITKKIMPTWDDAMRAVLTPILFFGSLFIVSNHSPMFYEIGVRMEYIIRENLGYFAFVGSAWYALLSVIYTRRLARMWDTEVAKSMSMYWQAAPSAALVIAFGFVAVGIPLQCYAAWITVSWMTVFAGLWFSGHRLKIRTFVNMSYVFFVLAFFRLADEVRYMFVVYPGDLKMRPVFNIDALPILAVALLLIAASVAASTCLPKQVSGLQSGSE